MVDRLLSIEWRVDEWTESAENEPEQAYPNAEFEAYWATVEAENKALADEADREWAQALTDETEDEQC